MSDIYDYAYIHVMRQPTEDNQYDTSPPESITVNEVNTSDFSPRDLQIFADSLETISRLEQGRHSQRLQKRNGSYLKAMEPTNQMVTCLDDSKVGGSNTNTSTSADEDNKSLYTYSESDYIYDETYYDMLPSIGQSSTFYSNLNATESLKLSKSESEESGVFLNQTADEHEYENIDPIRPRSKVVSHQKSKTLKSRLIALIMKKQYVQPHLPSVEFLSSTTIDGKTEEQQIYERVLDDVIQHQYTKNPQKGKKNKKYSGSKKRNGTPGKAEENFLDKAMRYLTL